MIPFPVVAGLLAPAVTQPPGAPVGPQEATGALCQSGHAARFAAR